MVEASGMGYWFTTSSVISTLFFPVMMRTVPTLSSPTVSNGYQWNTAGSGTAVYSTTIGVINTPSAIAAGIYRDSLSGGTAGKATDVNCSAVGAKAEWDAEL